MKKKRIFGTPPEIKKYICTAKKNRLSVLLFLHIFMWVIQKEGKYILFFEYK